MSSTVGVLLSTGKCKANNGTLTIRKTGFVPRRVVIENLTNQCKVEWDETLPDGYGIVTLAAGTRSLVTSAGIKPLAANSDGNPGFEIGALANINDTTTEDLAFQCWG